MSDSEDRGGRRGASQASDNSRVPPSLNTFAPENAARIASRVGTLERYTRYLERVDGNAMELEGESLVPLGTPGSDVSWLNLSGVSQVEVVAKSVVRPVSEYELLVDSEVVGELEWIDGWHPELHLEAGAHSGYVILRRLRPFVLMGRTDGPAPGVAEILHVGSAGQGLVEIDGVQFARRTGVTGRQMVRDNDGRLVLTSFATSGRGVLLYERETSELDAKWLLELTLVEAFCAIYTGRHMFRSMLTAWVRPPKMGTSLALLPTVSSLQLGSG